MANGEQLEKGIITQMSWTDGVSLDPYFGLENSFQYAENVNTDDELHGVKLAQKLDFANPKYNYGTEEEPDYEPIFQNCQLISTGENVMSLNPTTGEVRIFDDEDWNTGGTIVNVQTQGGDIIHAVPDTRPGLTYFPGVIFQDYFWYGVQYTDTTDPDNPQIIAGLLAYNVTGGSPEAKLYMPKDHITDRDEDIENPDGPFPDIMHAGVSAILNYNNARLVVAVGQDLRVYYPELDKGPDSGGGSLLVFGKTGWKKVMHFEDGCTIVGLTCTFEYLKVRVTDEGWNTKVYYYQGNNNLKSTYVYNLVDLTGTKVLRVFSINGIDYYISSLDGTDAYVMLYKLVGSTPYPLLKQRAGLTPMDINTKDPYFVGPIGLDAPYLAGAFYIQDYYGVRKFNEVNQTNDKYDRGYMKRRKEKEEVVNNRTVVTAQPGKPTGIAISKNFLYITDEKGIYKTRLYDTGKDGYQKKGILISREYEGEYGGCITKMLEQIRAHYELNPLTKHNGSIDVYVSPNNLWKKTDPEGTGIPNDLEDFYNTTAYDGWFHVMHIDQNNINSRTEEITEFNAMQGGEALQYDRQTLTYAIVITRNDSEKKATPIVRQLYFKYRLKGKTNNIDNLHN